MREIDDIECTTPWSSLLEIVYPSTNTYQFLIYDYWFEAQWPDGVEIRYDPYEAVPYRRSGGGCIISG